MNELIEVVEFFRIGLNLDEFGYLVNLGEFGEITVHRVELRLIGMNWGICDEFGFNLGEFW